MSRILKRPMFRMGGSTENVGIMDGMRNRYDNGGSVEEVLKELDKRAPAPSFGRSAFLRDFGLNLLSTPPQGNIFQTAAIAARDPVSRYNQAKAQSAANRREIMASLLGQEREQAFEMEKLDKQLEAQREIAGIKSEGEEALANFPDAGNPVVAKKLQMILDANNAIKAPGQIVPDGQNIVKTIQALNPDSGTVFALYSSLTGDVTKFVRVEKEKNNRVKLAEVDADGNDLPSGEGDAPLEEEEFKGFPIYKAPPKENIFEDLEDKSGFKAFEDAGA
jgi:hypothetical protein